MIYVVYHCFLVNNWKHIIKEQLERLVKSGLYEASKEIWMTVILMDQSEEEVESIISEHSKVCVIYSKNNTAEYEGIKKVKELGDNQENAKIFYFHTKGVSNIYTNSVDKILCEEKINNIKAWKECLEYFLIDKWKESVELLEQYDCVGVTNNGGWYWGNFWWVNSEYIKRCRQVGKWGRWDYEAWLNDYVDGPKKFYEWYKFVYNPYVTHIQESWYKDKDHIISKITLIRAYYGTAPFAIDEGYGNYTSNLVIDVTDYVNNQLEKNNYNKFEFNIVNPSNEDPAPNQRKFMFIEYYIDSNPSKVCKLGISDNTFFDFTP